MPHLNSLRAFESAARLGSFSLAANELFVTPGAIAQHVKSLEGWVGEKLFKRNAQGTELTPLGASVLADFIQAFDQLGEAVHQLRTNGAPREIRIAALPSVAQLWLSPRLPEIRAAMPELSISVTALEQPPNMLREPFDLAIFFEASNTARNSIIIGRDAIFPVCSPAIAHRLKAPTDLAGEVFLHDTAWHDDWKIWLSKIAPKENLHKSGPAFSLYALAIEECKNGAGILMGHEDLVRRQLETGSLVKAFSQKVLLKRSLSIKTAMPIVPKSLLDAVVKKLLNNDR
jgi:LysR family glycine cleavage system transcriptional activator